MIVRRLLASCRESLKAIIFFAEYMSMERGEEREARGESARKTRQMMPDKFSTLCMVKHTWRGGT